MSERETPGQDEVFDGWRARWSSRQRPYFATEYDPAHPVDWDRCLITLNEPVLVLSKPGRKFVEVKGQADIDRSVMLARGMTSALLCDAAFALEWGHITAAVGFEIRAERWHRVAQVRMNTLAVHRVGGRIIAGPAGAGAKGQ